MACLWWLCIEEVFWGRNGGFVCTCAHAVVKLCCLCCCEISSFVVSLLTSGILPGKQPCQIKCSTIGPHRHQPSVFGVETGAPGCWASSSVWAKTGEPAGSWVMLAAPSVVGRSDQLAPIHCRKAEQTDTWIYLDYICVHLMPKVPPDVLFFIFPCVTSKTP